MIRDLESELLEWKNSPIRMPLVLRGARQVGKTFIVERFGKKHFQKHLTVNFELDEEARNIFETLEPEKIISQLELKYNVDIQPKKILLFFDEIQLCPRALQSLRYFKEKMPELHVIAAGSLLEFVLNDHEFSFPVGRVQFMFLRPLSFIEYLKAIDQQRLVDELQKVDLENPLAPVIHDHLIKFVKEYFIIGGMPASIYTYIQSKSFAKSQNIQSFLLETYQNDFGKYASQSDHKTLHLFFKKAPSLITKDFKYIKIDQDIRSRELKKALLELRHAGLLNQVFSTKGNGIPLQAEVNEKKFKLLFLDIGLLQKALQTDAQAIFQDNLLLINEGALAEQFVGQELLAYSSFIENQSLFYWQREQKSSTAQVDYISTVGSHIIPIEVKSGKTGRLRSLKQFMDEKNIPLGVRISQTQLSLRNNILSIPLYLISQLPRLYKSLILRK